MTGFCICDYLQNVHNEICLRRNLCGKLLETPRTISRGKYAIVLGGETGTLVGELLRFGCKGFALHRALLIFKQSEMDWCKRQCDRLECWQKGKIAPTRSTAKKEQLFVTVIGGLPLICAQPTQQNR